MTHPRRRPAASQRNFKHQPFGAAHALDRRRTKDGSNFLDVLLDENGRRGILPATLIPAHQRQQLGAGDNFPVLVHRRRKNRFPILIHADRFVELEDDPGAVFTELLQHKSVEVRYQTCRLLTNLDSYRIEFGPLVTLLLQYLADSELLVRWYAALAIGKIVVPNSAVVEAVLNRFGCEESYLVRLMVGFVLEDWMRDAELAPSLRGMILEGVRRALSDPNANIRSLAVVIAEKGDASYQRPNWRELLRGTAPAATESMNDERLLSLVQDLTDENVHRQALAETHLMLYGASVTDRLAEVARTDNFRLAQQIHSVFCVVGLAAPESLPVLLRSALTDKNEQFRQSAASCLPTLLSDHDYVRNLLVHAITFMVRGADNPPWWCAPGKEFQLDAAEASAALGWLACHCRDELIQDMAVQALGLMDAAPLEAVRSLSDVVRVRNVLELRRLRPLVIASLERLRPQLKLEVPSLKASLLEGVPEDDIDWRIDALTAAGARGHAALCQLAMRFRLPKPVRNKLYNRPDIWATDRKPEESMEAIGTVVFWLLVLSVAAAIALKIWIANW